MGNTSCCWFQLRNEILRHIIEIPTGSDPATSSANHFLKNYERKWITKIKKTDIRMARKFANTLKFTHDLTVLNDGGEFGRGFRKFHSA